MTAKPKRKAKAAEPAPLDLEAWGQCCQIWDRMTGRTRAWRPDAGDGRAIAEAMARQGAAKIVARFGAASRDHWCRSLAAGRDARTGADARPLPMTALTRDGTDLVTGLDRAAEQAALDASPVGPGGASVASQAPGVGMGTPLRPDGSQAPDFTTGVWARALAAMEAAGPGVAWALGGRDQDVLSQAMEFLYRHKGNICKIDRSGPAWRRMGQGMQVDPETVRRAVDWADVRVAP